MHIRSARSFIKALRGDRCIFGYSGCFPDEHSPRLIELGEAVHNGATGAVTLKARLGYVMVEAYQNIVRHGVGTFSPWDVGRSMFLLRCHAEGEQVFACNLVTRSQAEKLDTDLADLQGRDNAELKELYLEGIQRISKPGTRGAGLGLIEMVRRTGGGATWAFRPVDEGHDLFAISLELGTTDGADGLCLKGPLHQLVVEHRIHLFHVGLWNADIEKVLVGMAGNESPCEGGYLPKRGEALEHVVGAFTSVCDLSAPVLFVLHGGKSTVFSMGGMVHRSALEQLRTRFPGPGAMLRVEEGAEGGKVLVTMEIPW